MEIWKKMWVGVFFWTQCINRQYTSLYNILIPKTMIIKLQSLKKNKYSEKYDILINKQVEYKLTISTSQWMIATIVQSAYEKFNITA